MVCAAAAALALAGCATAPAPDAQVSGTVFARERLYVPPDAYFEAALVDVTDDSAPPLVLARQRMDPAGPLPYALRIPYRQAQIQPEGRYEVRAAVRWRGRLLLDAPGVHPVLWTPLSRHADVQLALAPQSAATATAAVPRVRRARSSAKSGSKRGAASGCSQRSSSATAQGSSAMPPTSSRPIAT